MKEFKSFYKEVKGNEGNKCHWENNFNPNKDDCCNLKIGD